MQSLNALSLNVFTSAKRNSKSLSQLFRRLSQITKVSQFSTVISKCNRLTDLKRALVYHRSHLPTSLKINWQSDNLISRLTSGLPTPIQPTAQGLRFDVIVISEEGGREHFPDFTQLASLPIESLAATPSFLFLWLPSSDSLELGRALLQRWGFRRAEDIVWVKTNRSRVRQMKFGEGGGVGERKRRVDDSSDAVFVRTKEHCLMGIRGTVRRSVYPPPPMF
jgi:mRNA m6A methyltransferase non-catalytic subunit